MLSRSVLLSLSTLLSLTLLSACHRPERVEAVQSSDSSLDCAQIQDGIRYAEQARQAAREHDKFEFRYILIVPAFVSAYNFDKAEKAADARKAELEQLYRAKDCANQAQQATPPVTPFGGMPMTPGGPGNGFPEPTTFPGGMPMPGGPDNGFPPPAPYGYPPQGMPSR